MTRKAEADLRLTSFAGAACILSFLLILPLQMHQIEHFVSRHLAQLPRPKRPGSNIYFISPGGGFYMADMIQIDPMLRTPDLLLVNRGARSDADLVQGNWPNAIKIADGKWGEQWYLRPTDQGSSTASEGRSWTFNWAAPSRPE